MIKWLKALFCEKKVAQKKVLEKISVNKKFKKKPVAKGKKKAK